jgi:hypothetical protein
VQEVTRTAFQDMLDKDIKRFQTYGPSKPSRYKRFLMSRNAFDKVIDGCRAAAREGRTEYRVEADWDISTMPIERFSKYLGVECKYLTYKFEDDGSEFYFISVRW